MFKVLVISPIIYSGVAFQKWVSFIRGINDNRYLFLHYIIFASDWLISTSTMHIYFDHLLSGTSTLTNLATS